MSTSSHNGFYELYRDFLQQSSGFWARAATVPKPPDPSEIWQQFYTMWTEFWTKSVTQSPDTFQAAQQLWMEQLDTASKGLENIMGTEAYGSAVSRFFQEQLAWQDKIAKTANPQIDGALRAFNLPSRSQMNRLFERMVGMEERLDDLETESRQIGRSLRTHMDAVDEIKQHITTLTTQLTGMNQRLEDIHTRSDSTNQRLEEVYTQTEGMNQHLEDIHTRSDSTNQRLEEVYTQTEDTNQRLEDISTRVESLAQQIVALASQPEPLPEPPHSPQPSEAEASPKPQSRPRPRSRRKSTPDS